MEETVKVKASAAERLEAKVKAALVKRDRLLEALEKEISALEARLVKARDLRAKLGGVSNPGEVGLGCPQAPVLRQAPGPLRGFRSNGRQPPEPVDALIREGKIG